MEKHVRDLAHEAGVMKARLENLREAAQAVVDRFRDGGIADSTPAGLTALARLRLAVDRAALPIESPEVQP